MSMQGPRRRSNAPTSSTINGQGRKGRGWRKKEEEKVREMKKEKDGKREGEEEEEEG